MKRTLTVVLLLLLATHVCSASLVLEAEVLEAAQASIPDSRECRRSEAYRFGESKYGFLGRVYELKDFPSLPGETLRRLQAIVDEAFGRTGSGQ